MPMNRQQRRAAQSESGHQPILYVSGKAYAVSEAYALAIKEHGDGRAQAALDIFTRITAKFPQHGDAHYGRGYILHMAGQLQEALRSYDKAIALNPAHFVAHNNRGDTLRLLGRRAEALQAFGKAIALAPAYAEAHNNQGVTYREMKQPDAALASYGKAIALNPANAQAYNNRGILLQEMKRHEEALADYERAAALDPAIPTLQGSLLAAKMQLCEWRGIEDNFRRIAEGIATGEIAATPSTLPATPLSPELQRNCAGLYARAVYPAAAKPLWNGEKYAHDRLHIGYFSSDFRNHALSYLMAEFFELHDRARFEITAFSLRTCEDSEMRRRLKNAFDHFIDVEEKSDAEIARLARGMEIDIIVDLNGYTSGARTGVFALRPAPLQMSYMGYPATMGAPYIDYLMADAIVIPPEHGHYYTEKIVRLPHSYWVVDSTRERAEPRFTRSQMGLPESGFVFCCFNNAYKITPDVFTVWMRLLHHVEGSVLWLLKANPVAERNLRAEAKASGIAEHRLVFAERLPVEDHLARQRLADLLLDTFHYNAHTTASDALWEGVPVVTCLGTAFAGRVAASMLSAVGLPELVTRSHAEYETLALTLARNPARLSAAREKLAQNRAACPLFDTRRFTRHFGQAFILMQKRHEAGLPPEDIAVPV